MFICAGGHTRTENRVCPDELVTFPMSWSHSSHLPRACRCIGNADRFLAYRYLLNKRGLMGALPQPQKLQVRGVCTLCAADARRQFETSVLRPSGTEARASLSWSRHGRTAPPSYFPQREARCCIVQCVRSITKCTRRSVKEKEPA